MYLQVAHKYHLARLVIQGLTQTSESYEEAIRCLKEWHDRPRLVQEEHTHSIMDVIPVKNGSDRELLKAAETDSFEMVLTVILQQKLDKKDLVKVGGV